MSKIDQQALADMAHDATPEYKAKFKTKQYYQEQYEKYKEFNKKELERLARLQIPYTKHFQVVDVYVLRVDLD